MTGFVSSDSLNNLTNLYNRPIIVTNSNRIPTANDILPFGTGWQYLNGGSSILYVTTGPGVWGAFAPSSSGILTLTGNTGTATPISNNIQIFGTGSQLVATGAGGVITLALASAIITPGSLAVTTTLAVTGNTTLSSALSVGGSATLHSLSATTGSFSSTLAVTGNATFSGAVSIAGTLTLASITISGNVTLGNTGGDIITIGNTSGATAINMHVGTGNFTLTGAATSTMTVGTGLTSGTILIGGIAQLGTITLGSSSAANIVAIGVGAGATTVNIATGATAGKTVNIGTGAISNTITIGSVTGTSSLALLVGSGGLNITGETTVTGDLTTSGDDILSGTGSGLQITDVSTATASIGQATLTAGTVTVLTSRVTASSLIFVTYDTCTSTNPAALQAPQSAIVVGTSFVITSQDATDSTSVVNYWIIN